MKVTPEFKRDFWLVMESFRTPPDEVEVVKELVAADYVTAAAAIHSTAAMIRAGWKPLTEQTSAYLKRTTEAA